MKEILDELIVYKVIPANFLEYKPLKGGTQSQVFIVSYEENRKYIIKLNEPLVVEHEGKFLEFYKDIDILPKLIYIDPNYKYLVYTYLTGSTDKVGSNKKEVLSKLVKDLINHYKPVTNPTGWGWVGELQHSWKEFLNLLASEVRGRLGSTLCEEDHLMVSEIINKLDSISDSFLLHGDCGYHNFLFTNQKLSGVIDPTPVYGDPLYDLIYAYCSTPENLTVETIESGINELKHPVGQFLYEKVLIGLYFRIGTCIIHHPGDLEEYLKAWEYWKNIVLNGR